MDTKILIPQQTAEASITIWVAPHEIGNLLQGDGVLATDIISIQQINQDGTYSTIVLNSNPLTLSADNTQRKLSSINKIRIYKPVTTNPVGVSMITQS